jgi:UDPglucose--hexose-1-phosphate uridylyltransferase
MTSHEAELRRDPVIGRWIIVSPGRSKRPGAVERPVELLHESATPRPSGECPFCPGHEDRTPPEITALRAAGTRPNAPGWRRRVFRSASPVVSPDEELIRQGEGMFDMMTGFGEHEVIVDTADHALTLATLSNEDLTELILLWRDRFRDLKRVENIRCVTVFGNRGAAAGAFIEHSHSQIIATPALPRRLSEEISLCYQYFQAKERCVFCDIAESEDGGERQVCRNDRFVVLTPYASRFPYEMWILPKEHSSHFEEVDAAGAAALAEVLRTSLSALNKALEDPPYSFVLHTAPIREGGMVHYHWHLEIMPRLSPVAGFEWGTGFYINPVPPEAAAARLRAAVA